LSTHRNIPSWRWRQSCRSCDEAVEPMSTSAPTPAVASPSGAGESKIRAQGDRLHQPAVMPGPDAE
jgi:hypothetical protein